MQESRLFVIKLGTSTLTRGSSRLSRQHMLELVRQISKLYQAGIQVILVSSGAIAAGKEKLPHSKEEGLMPSKQMLSAVGQVRLMHLWTELFGLYEIPVGQVLLTREDFSNRQRYLNVRDTFSSLLQHGVLPIVNENDTVATQEVRVGDNDNLSAFVASMMGADMLLLLTDQEGLFTADPRTQPDAELITQVDHIDESIFSLAKGSGTRLGTGGMFTKVQAAKLATQSGTPTVICSSDNPEVIAKLALGQLCGTRFKAQTSWRESRKRWLLSEKPQGSVIVDQGAVEKIIHHGASLLAAGIRASNGTFDRGATVEILTQKRQSIAIGLSSYSSDEIKKIIGVHSNQIESCLGYSYGDEVVHRDNMTLLKIKEEKDA